MEAAILLGVGALAVGSAALRLYGRWLGRREQKATPAQQQLARVVDCPRREDRPRFTSRRS